MSSWIRSIRGAALLCAVPVCWLFAQTGAATNSPKPLPSSRLLGVFDATTGQPLAGVQVRDLFSGAYAVTTRTGTVRLGFLSFRGSAAVVELMKLGYEPKSVVVARGDTASITEILEPVATLAPVVTTETYRLDRDEGHWAGFDRRCQQTTVTCFRDSDLVAKASWNMADVLLRARGITLGPCSSDSTRNTECGRVAMHSAVIPPGYCEPSVFVDGFLWNPHAGSAIDERPHTPPTAPFTPADVKGIEVYSTEMPRPLRFEGDPFCGAVVIWTK